MIFFLVWGWGKGGGVQGREGCQSAPKERRREKASCGETVVQKGLFGESVLFSAPLRFALTTSENTLDSRLKVNFVTLRACYRAQKPQNPKNTKKIRNPPPQVGPRKYKKNTETAQKWQGHFCIFSVFFFVFSGPTWGGGFRIFSYFRGSGVLGSVAGPQGHKVN